MRFLGVPSGCALLALCVLGACGRGKNERATLQQERVLQADKAHVAEHAKELFTRYEEAAAKASAELPDSPARSDYETEARVWLLAAIAEGERVRLSEQRLLVERATYHLEAEALESEREAFALVAVANHQAARELSRQEEELVLARAALAPKKRIKLALPEVKEAAGSLCERTALVLLALENYGVPRARAAAVEAKLEQARALLVKNADEALKLADESLFSALSLLSEVRRSERPVDDVAKAALAEAVLRSGAAIGRNERGLSALLRDAYANRGLTPRAERVVMHLCAVVHGFPQGPVQVEVMGRSSELADDRVKSLSAQLAKAGCVGSRFRVDAVVSPAEELEVTWLGY